MPRDTDPSPRPLPPTLTEEVLCDYVEGLLPEAERARVREALGGSPEWSAIVTAIESQRRALSSLEDVLPPADLLDRVQAVLEREALVGLTEGERRAARDSIAVVVPGRGEGVLARLGPRLWRPLAAAAGIALVAVGGVYWARMLSQHGSTQGGTGPVATDSGADRGSPGIAMAEPTEARGASEAAMEAAAGPAALAPADPATPEVSPAQALALARDGRLLIRVVADRTSTAERAIETIASLRGDPVRGITVEGEVSPTVLAAVAPRPEPMVLTASARQRPENIMAMERPGTGFDPLALVPPGVLSPWLPVELPPTLGRTFVLELPGTQASLESMHKALASRLGRQVRIVLEELSAPAVAPPLDRAALLWWTGPASTWAPRIAVPLVVERER
ncbi:MAG: hypothetical protein FJ255_00670 [Phycisphaerae bacterium]|nr:hypothetical protein [Phycisphaerae bacterium]